jgi:hypothetical protein
MALEDVFEDINDGMSITTEALENWAMQKFRRYSGGELTVSEMTQNFLAYVVPLADMDCDG